MSAPDEPLHPSVLAIQAQGVFAPGLFIPIAAGLNPLIVMLEPSMNLDAMWRIVNANAGLGVVAVFTALEENASAVITSPSFEATLFAMGCKVAANLWHHGAQALMAPPPESSPSPAPARPPGTDPYGNVP